MAAETKQPLYARISDELTDRIQRGVYPVGSKLPTEMRLCGEFGASRHTVREALRRMVATGLITRLQKAGTTVVATAAPAGYVQMASSVADLFQFALDTIFTIVSQDVSQADEWLAARLQAEPGSSWLKVEGVRREVSGAVICHTTSFIPHRLSWLAPELANCRGPFYALLEERAGETIHDVVQEIRAEIMPDLVADSLSRERGSLALRLLRRYVTQTGTLIASFNWHPAESFTYVMRMHRTEAGNTIARG